MIDILIATTPFFDYYYSPSMAVCFMFLFAVGMVPLSYSAIREPGSVDYGLILFRRLLWSWVFFVGILGFVVFKLLGAKELGSAPGMLFEFNTLSMDILNRALISIVAGSVLGYSARFLYMRYFHTLLSSLKRKYRFNVSGDKESDIRDVIGKMEAKNYLPSKYHKLDKGMFLGLDNNDKPIYIDIDQFLETHTEIIGPTRSGKGVVMGVIAEQVIKQGHNFIYHDPKHDKFLPHIMKETADKIGAKFIFFDLNDEYLGSWNPFSGGTKREQRTRLMWALGMVETGSDADFYKLGEKKDIDRLLESKSWSVTSLIKELEKSPDDRQAKRAISSLSEIAQISTFTPKSGKGINWEHQLSSDQQAVIYIRGNLNDELIKKMHRLLLIEINQYIIRLEKEERRTRHVTQMVDEVNFLTSMPLADALATIGGFRCNMILAYQSPSQLRNVPDQLTDPDVVEESVHTNCQNKVIYRLEDGKLAEWAAEKTGKQFKTVKRMEQTTVDHVGAERWDEKGSYNKVEEYYITPNVFLGLIQRVGVLITPGQFASLIYTCFVTVEGKNDFFGAEYRVTKEKSKEESTKKEQGDKKAETKARPDIVPSEDKTQKSAGGEPPKKQESHDSETGSTEEESFTDFEESPELPDWDDEPVQEVSDDFGDLVFPEKPGK